jgi:glycine cleavage system H lipoate-binding protein
MEGFHYVDIFASKGLEYLLVLGFLAVFTVVWWLLNRPARKMYSVMAMNEPAIVLADINWFNMRDDVLYHPGHTWAAPEADYVYKVGIDDFAQKLLGKADSIKLPAVGTQLNQGAAGWQLNVGEENVDMLSPVAGQVIAVNQQALNSPGLVNEDPYDKGWLLKVLVPNDEGNRRNLIGGGFARAWMTETVRKLRERMPSPAGAVLQDGGLPVTGFGPQVWPEHWREVASDFLLTD